MQKQKVRVHSITRNKVINRNRGRSTTEHDTPGSSNFRDAILEINVNCHTIIDRQLHFRGVAVFSSLNLGRSIARATSAWQL